MHKLLNAISITSGIPFSQLYFIEARCVVLGSTNKNEAIISYGVVCNGIAVCKSEASSITTSAANGQLLTNLNAQNIAVFNNLDKVMTPAVSSPIPGISTFSPRILGFIR